MLPFSREEEKALNDHFVANSYVDGFTASQADAALFSRFTIPPCQELHSLHRWYKHITSFGSEKINFPGPKRSSLTLSVNGKQVSSLLKLSFRESTIINTVCS